MRGERLPDTIRTVPEALAYWAERTPGAPAFISPDHPALSYAGLWRHMSAWAGALHRAGFGRRDRVLLLVPDGPQLAAALLGTMAAAVAVPLDVGLTAAELDLALRGLGAAVAIVAPSTPPAARAELARQHVPVCEVMVQPGAGGATLRCPPSEASLDGSGPDPNDVALVLLTSGTTGRPKRVPDSHADILTIGRARRDQFGLTGQDRALAVAPLTLSLGTCVLFHSIVAGGAVIFPSASDPPTLMATIAAQRPTWMFPSAGLLEVLAAFLRRQPPVGPSSLRLVRVTAAPVAQAVCEEVAQRLGAPVLTSYSATETGLIATALPPPARHQPGSVGRPIVDVRIVDADERSADPGAEGEIWVRGPKFAAGYLDDPERNAAALRPSGWFRTGDVGYLDDDGFLFLTGRLSQLINRGGYKIAPAELDAALMEHPAVAAAAVFAVPDARLGEDVVAAVVPANGRQPSARDLRAWLLGRLSAPKVPRQIWFVDSLPRTTLGKVRRDELRRRWLAENRAPSAGAPGD
jgi:oxalate---CoA ligase